MRMTGVDRRAGHRRPAALDVSCAEPFTLAPWPHALQRLGQVATVLSLGLGGAWWGALLQDAWRGWQSWWAVSLAVLLIGALAVTSLRWWRQPSQPGLTLWWHRHWLALFPEEAQWGPMAGSNWRNQQGQPVMLVVSFDLGPVLLVRTQVLGHPPVVHWVREQALSGPWRWRLVRSSVRDTLMASSTSSKPSNHPLLTSIQPASGATSAAAPADSDFPPTQIMDWAGAQVLARDAIRWDGTGRARA